VGWRQLLGLRLRSAGRVEKRLIFALWRNHR